MLDFGLAHRLPEYETDNPTQSFSLLAEPETVAGTLAYIAPETLKTGQSDARSDVWSLGVLFYEMASGRQPYQGIKGLELVSKVMEDRPVPQLSALVPGSLRSIIHRCLEKDPARRYQNSREVLQRRSRRRRMDPRGPRPRRSPSVLQRSSSWRSAAASSTGNSRRANRSRRLPPGLFLRQSPLGAPLPSSASRICRVTRRSRGSRLHWPRC